MRLTQILVGLALAEASYDRIAGYAPGSKVTDHNAIDLDQAQLEAALGKDTVDYATAKAVYTKGGNSKSYATVTVPALTTAQAAIAVANAKVTGTTAGGAAVTGKLKSSYKVTNTTIHVIYSTGESQASYVSCKGGGLYNDGTTGSQMTAGCFGVNALTIGTSPSTFTITPTAVTHPKAGRTLQGFSTGAKGKMYTGCPGCPYKEYKMFYDYYQSHTYADDWVLAGLDGTKATMGGKGADFTGAEDATRVDAIKKGTAYMNVWMYTIREFEDAIDDCTVGCITCNDDPIHAWDEGVAFYTGSLEGVDGKGKGKLIYNLADKRCANYKTCGAKGDALTGTSQVNFHLFRQFMMGQTELQMGLCDKVRPILDVIVAQMTVPLVQGTMRYAFKVDKMSGGAKEKAEGATFAAAVLPILNFCSATDAATVYNHMKIGATTTTSATVKKAFEDNYKCMNITCADIGGLWDEGKSAYFAGMEPCEDASTLLGLDDATVAAIAAGAAVAAILLLCVICMITREKAGKPIFYDLNGKK